MSSREACLRVIHLVAADHRRGAEQAARHLADALVEEGIEGRVVSIRHHREASPLPVDACLVPQEAPRLRWLPVAVTALRGELARRPADVILAHGTQAAFVAALAATGGGPPWIWHRILEMSAWPRWHPHHLRLRWLAARAHGVVAITAKTAEEVRRLGYRGPVWHLPNHRPAKRFAHLDRPACGAELRAELGIDHQVPLLGSVGYLVQQKQPEDAVEVLRRVREGGLRAHLVVAGGGPRRPLLEAAVRAADMGGAVHLLGHRDDVERIMAALDVLILTSSRDSMPGVVVEAQLAGCPVVSYPVDGIEMALAPGRSGVVTAGADPEEMAKRVEEILGDPTRHDEMVAAARAHARGLSTEQLAPRYAHLLSMVAGTIRTGSPRPLRVLHVLPDLGVGGAERALEVLAAHVDAAQVVQAVVVVGGARRPLPETVHDGLQKLGVPYCDLGVTRRPSRSVLGLVLAATRLGRVARRFGTDVVDAALFDAALPARLARGSWATVTHLVNTPYEPTVLQAVGARRWRAALLRRIDQWSARRDDALVALTEAVAETARHHLALEEGDPRLLVIPRGVDLDRFSPIPLPSDAGGTLTITTVGRLVPQKGHDVLIRAVARARAAGTPLRLRIAGEGPLAEALAELVRSLDLAEMVEVISPTLEVPSLLHASHIFALASRWEGQSNAVLEAMACGLPILVSDLAVLREVVGDAGRFVPADDVEAWAAALAELAPDADERRRLGAAARSRVEQRYGAPARSAELACLYRRVAART